MNELVGKCIHCGKNLYCMDGFFNGVHIDNKQTLCFDCAEKKLESVD